MNGLRYRREMKVRPRKVRGGEMFCAMPLRLVERRAEEVLIVSFMADRKLFGLAYLQVQPDHFDSMPIDSGVFVCPLVRTSDIFPLARRPGDIDLLIIPYENNELVLERVLAVEVKAVRAKFSRPSKSPNEFGFSQASSLLDLGFPYVAVAHLIISDTSPQERWCEMMTARVLDREGNVEELGCEKIDPLPGILTDRTFGRLQKNCPTNNIGLISAYVFSSLLGNIEPAKHMIHFPSGRRAQFNPHSSIKTVEAVASYFDDNPSLFLDTPRFDPT